MPRLWFALLDPAGRPYKQAKADTVEIPDQHADISVLRRAVHAECSGLLVDTLPLQLDVYQNKHAFDNNEDPLESDAPIAWFA